MCRFVALISKIIKDFKGDETYHKESKQQRKTVVATAVDASPFRAPQTANI